MRKSRFSVEQITYALKQVEMKVFCDGCCFEYRTAGTWLMTRKSLAILSWRAAFSGG